jgi:hypothetical protein
MMKHPTKAQKQTDHGVNLQAIELILRLIRLPGIVKNPFSLFLLVRTSIAHEHNLLFNPAPNTKNHEVVLFCESNCW